MKPLSEILGNINECCDKYEQCKFLANNSSLNEIGRDLAVNLKRLSDLYPEYRLKWNRCFMDSKMSSDKKREIESNINVPEYALIKMSLKIGEDVLGMIRTNISSTNKNG